MTVLADKTLERVMPDGRYVLARAKLEHLEGNRQAHFSLTGEEWKTKRHYDRQTDRETGLLSSGACHDVLLDAFPTLAFFESMHSANEDGSPMHAVVNGWYWYADYDGKGTHLYPSQEPMFSMTPHQRAAHHLRIHPDDLPEGLEREEFAEFVETLRPRWQEEADAALAFLRGEA